MTTSQAHYLNARDWAKLVAYIWLQPAFAEDFESNPIQAIYDDEALRKSIGFRFEPDKPGQDTPVPITRIIKLPNDPGYSSQELYGAIVGEVTIIPMTSWNVHGT